MRLIYFDEIKHDPPNQTSFWLGGLGATPEAVLECENGLNELALQLFGTRALKRETEFHGIEIVRGKAAFKGMSIAERQELLAKILEIITETPGVQRIYVRIIPSNIVITRDDPADIGFMYFVEQCERYLVGERSHGMLLGDYDEPVIGTSVANLSRFREGGTFYRNGISINQLIDTTHFCKSHHSRMIQLADVFVYSLQFIRAANNSAWRQAFSETIQNSNIHRNCVCREWPTWVHDMYLV